MMKQLENEIRDLKRKLAEIRKYQADLRLQPCCGDPEIKGKQAKLDELDKRTKALNETLRETTKKRQLLISQATTKGSYESPSYDQSP
jgi:uncharacterized coiled-coil DUF342 family protein